MPIDLQSILKSGDCLLYKPKGFFGRLIAFKTYHRIAHVEIYIGSGKSVASRDGKGVGLYPLRDTEVAYVLRPQALLDWAGFWKWFRTVNGQGYDWLGILRFAVTHSIGTGNNGKMFCSEFAARAYWVLGAKVFSEAEDADAIVPADFLKSAALTPVAIESSLR